MSYHSDRFEDYSLMIYDDKKLIAVLPANRVEAKVHSHQGLTYGGLIYAKALKTTTYIACFKAILKYLEAQGITHLHLKALPHIFLNNAEHDPLDYICFKLGIKPTRLDLHATINMNYKMYSNSRKEGVKRAQKHQLIVKESDTFDDFWTQILIPNLREKHQIKPVHTLEEITHLKTKFPNHIRQFNVYHNTDIVAGVTIFEMKHIAHCQYISSNNERSTLGSLDLLHHHLIEHVYADKRYFNFGISNVNNGEQINEGLLFWKEGFGARSVSQKFYTIPTETHERLDTIFV